MNDKDRKILESLGWTSEMLDTLQPTPATIAIDRMFLEGAQNALAGAGYGALEFLAANPGMSKYEMAKRLNRGATAIGLIMAIYDEAAEKGIVRETAKELLIRQILNEFSDGWMSNGEPDAVSKLGGWLAVSQYGRDPQISDYARSILRHLTIDHPPRDGWRPQPRNDPLIDEVFDRYWPVEPSDSEPT